MRTFTINLEDILSLISVSRDYGFEKENLLFGFSEILNHTLNDDEIEEYARTVEKEEGCGEEEYMVVKKRLMEFKEKYCKKNMETKIVFDHKDRLFFMFDIPKPYSDNSSIMTSKNFLRFDEIRPLFYKTDLSKLEDFSVIVNSHADGYLGTYIVRYDYVYKPFMKSDDFDVFFTLKEYNERKKISLLTEGYNFLEQLERFKNESIYSKAEYNYYQNIENYKQLNLRTKWNVITYEGSPIALISDYDSWRLLDLNYIEFENIKYQKFRVKNLEEGIEYIKYFI